jgi:hypothetical protein
MTMEDYLEEILEWYEQAIDLLTAGEPVARDDDAFEYVTDHLEL